MKRDIGNLLAAADWQETLLQSYRSLHLTLQSIFLATGAGLTVAATSIEAALGRGIATTLLVLLGALALWVMRKLKGVVEARGEDINWWHVQIILAESKVKPEERHFVNFKLHQRSRRAGVEDIAPAYLSDAEITQEKAENLVGRGLGHTRKVLDVWLFRGLTAMWLVQFAAVGTYWLVIFRSGA